MQQPQKNMNQRASHFSLGNTNQTGASIYAQDYTRKPHPERDPNFKVIDPFKGNSINPSGKSNFSTTNNAAYRNWNSVEKAGLDKEKLKDLRAHHFNLGSYNPNQATTTNQFYHNPKEISSDALKNREESKNRMRAHYHDFKQQAYTNFKSTYNKQFVPKDSDYAGKSKPQTNQNAIVFGNHHLPMVSTNNAQYTKKQGLTQQNKSPIQQSSSLVLGDKSQSMETMNQLYYGEKPLLKNQLPEATMKQLRNTHFNLGGMSNNFQTEMSSNYGSPPAEAFTQLKSAPHYESGAWVQKDAKFQGVTTNNRELPARKIEPYTKAKSKTNSQFMLGNQGNHYLTEFSQNFNPKEPSYTGKVQKPKDNTVSGFDKGTYQTEHRSNFKPRNLDEARCKIDIAVKSKVDHVQIGTGHSEIITEYQDEYRKDQQNKCKMFHKDNAV